MLLAAVQFGGQVGRAQTSIAFVQVNSAVPQSSQTAVTIPFGSAQTAGNLNVVVVGWNDSTAQVQSVTDTKGNVYVLAIGPTIRSGAATQSVFFAKNIFGSAAGANVVTVRFNVAAGYADIRVAEYRGIDPVNPLDVAIGASGSSASSNSGAVVTTNANDLLVGANIVSTMTTGPGTGFTRRVITSPDGDILEDRIVAATGSYSATATLSSSGAWVMQMVAFRAASGTTPSADLTVTKTHAAAFRQGQAGATYTLTATNSGTGPTSGTVTVTDTLPTGLTATALGGTGWSCTLTPLACTRGDALAAGGSYPVITLTVNVAGTAPPSVTNMATVGGGGETNTANDTASDVTTITGVPDLTLTKTHPASFTQGQTGATYTLTATNGGTGPTSGTVTVTDTLPTGLTATALSGTGWSCTLTPLACTRSDALAAGGSYPVITLRVNVAATAPASVTNVATVGGGGETNTANDTASDVTAIAGVPDLTLTKTHPASFRQGQTGASYTLTASNSGTGPTSGTVTVSDTLPSGLTATALSGPGWSCTLTPLACMRSDALGAAASYPVITLTVNVAPSAPASVSNVATVGGGGETNTANDTANDVTAIAGVPDLTLTKTHAAAFTQGQTGASYSLMATNSGTGPTSGTVTVSDTLPSELTATALSGTGWSCTLTPLACTRSDGLAAGGSYPVITLIVNVAATAAASVTNVATVGGGGETNTANDTASDATTIGAAGVPDLRLTKTHAGTFTQGQTGASYTLTASNSGTGPTSGTVTVSDTLPSELTATALSGTGWSCTVTPLACTRSDALAAGGSYPVIALVVNVAPSAPASVTNVATVGGGGDTNTANDTASDVTAIAGVPDLTLTKTHAAAFTQGQTGASYTLTATNSGTGPTSGTVTVSDTLPSELTATALSGTGWSCTLTPLACTRSDALAAGGSYPVITLTVNVAATAPASVTNVATVGGGGETNTANDTASDGTAITSSTTDTQPPTAPSGLTATASGAQVTLNWTPSTDNVGVTLYRVEQCQGASCTTFAEIGTVNAGPAAVPLSASANPNYFKDASGAPLILSGSHTWNSLQDWGTNGTLHTLDFPAFVNFLVAHGHNITFLWRTELPKFCGFPSLATSPPDFTVGPHPWQRTGPGTATDGMPTFDLTRFDQGYFDRLRTRVQALNTAGIYAGVYLFTGEWLDDYRCATDGYPFTGGNNVNGIDGGPGTASVTMSAPNAISGFQDAYVEKVIDTLNDLPNVLWIVSEEAPPSSTWWNDHQIAHIRSYESGLPLRHPIGYGIPSDLTDSVLINSNADWINPVSRLSPTTSCGTGTPTCKVNVNDSDHSLYGMWNSTEQQNRIYAWENFTNGNQVAFMDPYVVNYSREGRNLCVSPTNGICNGPDTRWDNFRDNLGYILRYSRKVNLANVLPRSSLCSSQDCLAQTPPVGAEYLIYAPYGGTFTVNLSAMSSGRTLNVEWFNPATGVTTSGSSIPAGSSSQSFTPPFSGDAVLYLVDSAGHAGSTAPVTSYTVTGLTAGDYGYRVRAADAAVNLSPYSNVANATIAATGAPDLTVTKTHAGGFTQGQSGASYTLTATNNGTAPTNGTVTVSDTLPSGLTATGLSGAGWTCTLSPLACARSNALPVAASYPPITLTVNVSATAPPSVSNVATVGGGGQTNTANDTATDVTAISGVPDLTVTKTHAGTFTQGQTAATYTLTATNNGTASTNGTVTVSDTLPGGLTATGLSGTGWTCTLSPLACTRSNALAAAASYPPITLTVNVAGNAPASVTNVATVGGGGETNTANDTASDVTTIGTAAATPITLVQHTSKDAGTTTSSTLAFTANNTAGNWLAVAIRAGKSGQVFTVTDTRGNTYRRALQFNETSDATTLGLFYAENVAGGANTVTVADSLSGGTLRFAILEYSGVALANSLDGTGAAQGNGSSASSGTITTTASGDLVIGMMVTANSATFTAGGAFAIEDRVPAAPNAKLITEDQRQATSGPIAATATIAPGQLWGAAAAAFRAKVSGPPPPADLTMTKTHTGTFAQGQSGATYSLTVTNGGAGPTAGNVSVSDTLPTDLTATALSGTGWTCTLAPLACTRSDVLAAGASYPPATLTVSVANNAGPSVTNVATVSGGGETITTNDTASDVTTITSPDTQPPSAPGTLTATALSGTQVRLSWGPAADNVAVTNYRVERCQGTGCSGFVKVASPAGTTYTDTGLTINTVYNYVVRAEDGASNLGPYSNVASVTTLSTIPELVASYSFNDGAGTTVADASGRGNVGTISNATWTTAGKYGSALVFNGSNARVSIVDAASLHLTTAMTLEAWVNPSTITSSWRDVIYKGNDNYYLMAATTNAGTPGGGGIFGGANVLSSGLSALPVNTWTYLAVTYDGATLRLFVNGTQVSSRAQSGAIAVSTNPLELGGDSIFGQFFQGMIDEVRVYNIALTPTQIQADMTSSAGGSFPAVSLSRTSVDFGTQATATTSSPQTVTITNTGNATLTLSSITVSGANSSEFAQSNSCGGSLAAGGNCTISVTFTPVAAGARNAAITITDNAPGSPHTVVLTGTGFGFTISPRTAVLTPILTQLFTVSSASGVAWAVDGVTGGSAASGTVTPDGLYTPPPVAGTHTVTVTTTDQLQSSSATVYVTNYTGVFTHHNDNARTGQNLGETVLTPASVTPSSFGKLLSYPLDGMAMASPLYVASVAIPGQGLHNVVYVATQHDSVYAFDADGLSGTPLWQRSFLSAGVTPVPAEDTGECCDISPEIGITGTPVIDPATSTLYVVAKTKEGASTYVQRLHALDLGTGAEKLSGPVVLQASVPGNGNGSSGGSVAFDALHENQRPALLLNNGVVYIAFGSHGDVQPYHGWVLGYDANSLQQVMAINASPNADGGGIWQANGGPAADAAGNIYIITGNGAFDANAGKNYGDTFLKISPAGTVVDYFTPYNQAMLNSNNFDLGAAGPLLLPDQPGAHPHLMVSAGKNNTVYLVDRDAMGHYSGTNNDNQIVQSLVNIFPFGTPEPGNYSAAVYFNGTVYFGPIADNIQAFPLTNGLLRTSALSRSQDVFMYPGATMAVSANGSGNGILWAIQRNGDCGVLVTCGSAAPGVLKAYDPANLGITLYSSDTMGGRDTLDYATKFSVPLIANGRVFIASMSKLTIYGLLP